MTDCLYMNEFESDGIKARKTFPCRDDVSGRTAISPCPPYRFVLMLLLHSDAIIDYDIVRMLCSVHLFAGYRSTLLKRAVGLKRRKK